MIKTETFKLDNNMNFIQQQSVFTAHVRDPDNNPVPVDVDTRRMTIYQELIYNNFENFIASAFPVLHEISSDTYWHGLIRKFIKHHHAHTPLFHKLPQEFLQYLQDTHQPVADDFTFLYELAHYEWVELDLSVATEEIKQDKLQSDTDILNIIPALSPLARTYSYQFDVHKISPDYIPKQATETPNWLLVYRNREDEVNFMQLNAITTLLLEKISDNTSNTCEQLLIDIAREINHPMPETVITYGQELLADLFQRDVLLVATNH